MSLLTQDPPKSISSNTNPPQTQTTDEPISLSIGKDNRIYIKTDDGQKAVSIHRCFPWMEPRSYLSLRDDDGEEVVLISCLAELNDTSRQVIEQALDLVSFTIDVIGITDIRKHVEIRHWEVQTTHGPRHFQTLLDEWPQELPDGSVLVKDVAGDLYRIGQPETLDAQSRKHLWALTS